MSDETRKITAQLPSVEDKPVVCSVLSRIADEQLFGTVSKTLIWFLLEYRSTFGAKAFEESLLPEEVKEHLSQQLASNPESRLLMIRQRSAPLGEPVRFFTIIGRETAPVIYEFRLPNYEALLSMDISKVISGEPAFQKELRQQPLYLVCTNGRRDPCCAKWGQAVFDEVERQAGASVWQCSHLGGHRFAANLLCFPHGIYYGRVDPSEVANLLGAYERGRISLANYRGRACYPPQAQAAEFFLRSQTGSSLVDDCLLQSIEETGPGQWTAQFEAQTGGKVFNLGIAGEPSDYLIYESCKSPEPARQIQYRLIEFQERESRKNRSAI